MPPCSDQDEQHALALRDVRRQRLRGVEFGVDLRRKLRRLVVGADRLADHLDLLEDALVVESFRHLDDRARSPSSARRSLPSGRCRPAPGLPVGLTDSTPSGDSARM